MWAKDLFAKLFGDKNQENDLNVRSDDGAAASNPVEDILDWSLHEDILSYRRRIYDHIFWYNMEKALANNETWKNRRMRKPIFVNEFFPDKLTHQNGTHAANRGTSNLKDSAMSSFGLRNAQGIWCLQ